MRWAVSILSCRIYTQESSCHAPDSAGPIVMGGREFPSLLEEIFTVGKRVVGLSLPPSSESESESLTKFKFGFSIFCSMADSLSTDLGRPTFPPELCDYIVDFLWCDKRTLAACSATCRGFVPVSRCHIFRSVNLHKIEDYKRFYALLDNSFSAGIAPHVRSGMQRPQRIIFICYLRRILATLTKITRLSLRSSHLADIPVESAIYDTLLDSICGSRFSANLTALSLVDVNFVSFRDFQRLVTAYPSLSSLHMVRIHWCKGNPSVVPNDSGPIRLDEMIIRWNSECGGSLLDLVSHPTFELRLRRLAWHGTETKDVAAVKTLLRGNAPFLEHLHLALPSYRDDDTQDLQELSACTCLVSVRVASRVLSGHPGLLVFLSHLRSPHLQKVVFDFGDDLGGDAACWPGEFMDESLAALVRAFPRLCIVFLFPWSNVNGPSVDWLDFMRAWVVRTLPLSSAAGMTPTVKLLEEYYDWGSGERE
ncbi:hypothetical protein B0H21DRAFT_736328 [Amylocystis lapponica]|nr:hypothetical protein B0H21DRAFT_736328 [Amylocystis lapponica]